MYSQLLKKNDFKLLCYEVTERLNIIVIGQALVLTVPCKAFQRTVKYLISLRPVFYNNINF